MRSMGLCCGRPLVESRLSALLTGTMPPATAARPPPTAASVPAVEEEAEWWRGRPRWCRMESAGGEEGEEEGNGEWAAAAWPLDTGDGCGDREERRRAAKDEYSVIHPPVGRYSL